MQKHSVENALCAMYDVSKGDSHKRNDDCFYKTHVEHAKQNTGRKNRGSHPPMFPHGSEQEAPEQQFLTDCRKNSNQQHHLPEGRIPKQFRHLLHSTGTFMEYRL